MDRTDAGSAEHDPLVRRLLAFDTCSVSDALDRLGMSGAVLGLRYLVGQNRFGGHAVTVKLGPAGATAPTRWHLGTRAIESAGPEDVIVVEHGGRVDVAGWGGLLSLGATLRGVAGVVVDGAVRDVDEADALGLPIVARCGVPVTARSRAAEVSTNQPVTVAGVDVAPGDLVLADRSGVVIVASAHADEVLAEAEVIATREAGIAAEIRAGRPISEAMASAYESMLDRATGQ